MFLNRFIYVWIIILLQILLKKGADCHSGWFVDDNGASQTILKEYLPRVDAQKLQDVILDMLGLPYQPQMERFPSKIRKSVPKFLLRIYKQLNQKDDELDEDNPNEDGMFLNSKRNRRDINDGDNITDENARIIEKSDFIMTFLNNRNAIASFQPDNRTRLSFDLSEVSPNVTQSLLSELHLYKRRMPEQFENDTLCMITIYAITVVDGIKALRPTHTSKTTVNYEGWIRINFTSMLNTWLIKTWSNNLIYITMDYQNDNGIFEKTSVDINYLLSFWDDEHQPFVTAYFNNENILRLKNSASKKHRRLKRSLQYSRPLLRETRSKSISFNPLINKNVHSPPIRPCQRYMLYVSFKDLQWEWIIAPEGYNAYYCSGQCGFPAPNNVAYTNHAIIQNLVHLSQNSKIPLPCCAPTKLGSINVIYIPKETSVHLRKYPKMIAKSCGCQ